MYRIEKNVLTGETVKVPLSSEEIAQRKVIQAELDATQYQRDRQPEYPSLATFADAYYWAQKGDNTKMDEYVASCDAVKAKYPKPE
jgi:hypothetical protein